MGESSQQREHHPRLRSGGGTMLKHAHKLHQMKCELKAYVHTDSITQRKWLLNTKASLLQPRALCQQLPSHWLLRNKGPLSGARRSDLPVRAPKSPLLIHWILLMSDPDDVGTREPHPLPVPIFLHPNPEERKWFCKQTVKNAIVFGSGVEGTRRLRQRFETSRRWHNWPSSSHSARDTTIESGFNWTPSVAKFVANKIFPLVF